MITELATRDDLFLSGKWEPLALFDGKEHWMESIDNNRPFNPYNIMHDMVSMKTIKHVISPANLEHLLVGCEHFVMNIPGAVWGDCDELCPLEHYFTTGLYIRELTIPKGISLTGLIHRQDYPSFLLKGKLSMLTELGIEYVEAPKSILSLKGVKRFICCHEDAIWNTVHPNPDDIRDIKVLEDMFLTNNYDEVF